MGPTRGRSVAGVAAALFLTLAGAGPASAAANTYTVSGFTDAGGSCAGTVCPSLRVAVQTAELNPGSTVQLGAGTYLLSSGQLQVTATASSGYALTIAGAGPSQTIIKQTDGVDRVMLFDGGPDLLKNLEVTGGNVVDTTSGGEDLGGGIYANANLSLDHVAVIGNTVTAGPGNATGGSPIAGGNAFGGGLAEITSAPVTFLDSTFAGNKVVGGTGGAGGTSHSGTAGGAGFGAAMSLNGSATIIGSTISGNAATGGAGGGSISLSPGNGGNASGGGIQFDGTLDMVNSTVAQNSATGGAAATGALGTATSLAGNAYGGGVDTSVGPDDILLLYSDTLDGNTAAEAGNLYTGSQLGVLTLDNTVLAEGVATNNLSSATANCEIRPASGLTLTDDGHNFESDPAPSSGTSACDLDPGRQDLFGSSPGLNGLADNGGPTETMFPQSGSPLLRAGGACLDPSQTPAVPLTSDQRGQPRGSTCDIGAVQVQAAAATGQPTLSGTPAVGQTLSCSGSGIFTGEGLTIGYAWLRNGTPVGGATGTSYQLMPADAGTTVSCDVTAVAIAGAPVTVSASVAVPALPAALTPGTVEVPGRRLTAFAGKVRLKLDCLGGTVGCAGKLQITIVIRHRPVRLAGGNYRIGSGATRTFTLKLSARARALLARHARGVGARLTLRATGGGTISTRVTIRPKPTNRRKR